jgi:hypothetical protein
MVTDLSRFRVLKSANILGLKIPACGKVLLGLRLLLRIDFIVFVN